MTVLPDLRALPLKENVAATLGLETKRSSLAMENEISVEELPTLPDDTLLDMRGSALVAILTTSWTRVSLLMVRPCRVMATEELPASVEPAVVITIMEEFTIVTELRLLPATDENPVIVPL